MIDNIVAVGEALPTAEAQLRESHIAWIGIEARSTLLHTPILFAVDVEAMQMCVAPGKSNLEDVVAVCQRGLAGDKQTAPDQGTDALEDDAELIDVGWDT